MSADLSIHPRTRLAVRITGLVQGVGFRPFVHAEATARGLSGWVRNSRAAVELEIEGLPEATDGFLASLKGAAPSAARIDTIDVVPQSSRGEAAFRILASETGEGRDARTMPAPDRAPCAACRAEVAQARGRRAGYPFTACTVCGPRYSMIEALPYDRARTSLRHFPLCNRCAAEYADPGERRFHAEAIACPLCGPSLELRASDGAVIGRREEALAAAVAALRAGVVVALKGVGGYQLLVDATDGASVARLRERKARDEKPFALLVATLEDAGRLCVVSDREAALLASPAAPIVLLDKRQGGHAGVALGVAPGLRRLGVMLPASPLHDLLASGFGRPLVCTSGNRAEEPLCIGDDEALSRLAGIADLWLAHDRAIVRPIDDSVVQIGAREPEILRRARGYAPAPLLVPGLRGTLLAFGGQQKSTAALLSGGRLIVGEHVGDLGAPAAVARLERSAMDLCAIAGVEPEAVACDAHPDFASTRLARRWAEARRIPLFEVQHHHAHAAACLVEHGIEVSALALVWDGAGLGDDGTLWGGEALAVDKARFERRARLRPFPLPGGTRAIRDPVLSLVGLAVTAFGREARGWLTELGLPGPVVSRALEISLRPSLSVQTSSMGRLFDGVAALLGVRREPGYEAVAAMQLEAAANEHEGDVDPCPFPLVHRGPGEAAELDFAPLLRALAADRAAARSVASSAARFHETLAAAAVTLAADFGPGPVVLTGGCFQNRRLSGQVRARLEAAGRTVYSPRAYPANDGGLSLGQAAVAAWRLEQDR